MQAAMTLLKALATTSTSHHLVVTLHLLPQRFSTSYFRGRVWFSLHSLWQVISLITRLKSRLLQPLWTVSELDHDILSDSSYSH